MRIAYENLIIKEHNNVVILLNPYTMSWAKVKKEKYDEYLSSIKLKEQFIKILDQKFNMFEKRKEIEESSIRSVYYAVTRKCNMQCTFCTMNSTPDISIAEEITLKDISSIVIPKINSLNVKKIVITGGEPLVREDLVSILKLFSDEFGRDRIVLQTNGLLLNSEKLEVIKDYIGAIEISIENLFCNTNMLNRMKNTFDFANKFNIVLGFSFVIDTNTVNYLLDAVDLCHKYNAIFTMRIVSPVGRAAENNLEDNIFQSKSTLEIYCKVVEYIIEKEYFEENIVSCFSGNFLPQRYCGAFGKILAIHPDGTTYMCNNFKASKYSPGNIIENPMEEIVNNLNSMMCDNEYIKDFCVDKNLMCKNCDIKYFCSGPCMAEVAENTERIEKIKEKCAAKMVLMYYSMFYYNQKKSVKDNLQVFLDYMKENIKKL